MKKASGGDVANVVDERQLLDICLNKGQRERKAASESFSQLFLSSSWREERELKCKKDPPEAAAG